MELIEPIPILKLVTQHERSRVIPNDITLAQSNIPRASAVRKKIGKMVRPPFRNSSRRIPREKIPPALPLICIYFAGLMIGDARCSRGVVAPLGPARNEIREENQRERDRGSNQVERPTFRT